MMFTLFYVGLLGVPVLVLLWRVVVSKQKVPVRAGAAICAMLTMVGAATMPRFAFGESETIRLTSVRDGVAILAAACGPLYLLFWSRKHRGRAKSKTVSIIGAIVGLVPIVATLATALIYAGEH